ncbi:hypothetical protein GPECTOR_23g13 [Gonium pectorale]|uniref:Uncharacterized protein n=1 Tax=Gonium pectorale TaxID=33097 RepID=A0A150GGX8_GONPE|nr:hypothetical protein GPECTOR_23g13 [Gonium pectorale]|eukprot:KXZ49043.1 hypothetical protein GPECTOR_23g13 [Gonium pectorale]
MSQGPAAGPVPQHWSVDVWPQLPPELAERIVSSLDHNEIAGTFCRVNKATAERFSGPQQTTIRLSERVPTHAFAAHWLAPGATRGLTLEQRKRLVRLVAASDVLANLEVALQAAGFVAAVHEAFDAAAGAGHLSTCQWLWDYSRGRTEDFYAPYAHLAVASAAGGGHRHVCEWLLSIDPKAPASTAIKAARGGHADLAEWLFQQGPPLSAVSFYMSEVAHGCDLPVLQRAWLRLGPSLSPHSKETLLSSAASSPTPDWAAKVEWLEALGCRPGTTAALYAAELPDCGEALARLTWLRGRGYPVDGAVVAAAACNGNTAALQALLTEVPVDDNDVNAEVAWGYTAAMDAAAGGHLTALQALHAAGCPMQEYLGALAPLAARAGHLHVLVWLLGPQWAEPVVLDEYVFTAAVASGSVELLAWLRQRGCPWGSSAFAAAAEAGGVELLAWLRQRGCPYSRHVYTVAAEAGCVAALEWLAEQGCLMEESGQPYAKACANGDMAAARCLRRLGVPWGPTGHVFLGAAEQGFLQAPLPLLRWLLREGCPVDFEAFKATVLKWPGGMSRRANEVVTLVDEHMGRRQQ